MTPMNQALIDAIHGDKTPLKIGDDYIAPNLKAIDKENYLDAEDILAACLRRADSLTVIAGMITGDSGFNPHKQLIEDLIDTANSLIAVSRELLESYALAPREHKPRLPDTAD